MHASHSCQVLSYDLRLPDDAQADALRLLEASGVVVNRALEQLWGRLACFGEEYPGPAWKQVGEYAGSPDVHGCRQWRCESEMAGRILRAQAARQRAFALVLPILTDGFIRPRTESRPAGKNRLAIKEAVSGLKAALGQDSDEAFVALQNVVEQACNYFFEHDEFPQTYEQLQPIPRLKVGLLSYAGDDGPIAGQSYCLTLDMRAGVAYFRFRYPTASGIWQWRAHDAVIPLPPIVQERIKAGEMLAPTLREEIGGDGRRVAVLDLIVDVPKAKLPSWQKTGRVLGADWGVHTLLTATAVDVEFQQTGRPFFLNTGGFDGRQARTRRQIDRLKRKAAACATVRDALPVMHPTRIWQDRQIARLQAEVARCWGKYERRNRSLAHLAANVLIVLAQAQGCSLLAMESLKTLKSTGRGKSVQGRWRNYRNNTTIRGEIWRLLRYKCHLHGLRFHTVAPRGTSHICPRCGKPARTYRSPSDRARAVDWGRWLWCAECGYNADRDYVASVNIARLGVAYLLRMRDSKATTTTVLAITDPTIKPVSYTGAGSVLLLPPTGDHPARDARGTRCYYRGWPGTVFLQSSEKHSVFLRLCG